VQSARGDVVHRQRCAAVEANEDALGVATRLRLGDAAGLDACPSGFGSIVSITPCATRSGGAPYRWPSQVRICTGSDPHAESGASATTGAVDAA
jgi:hypothetical protein